MVNVEGHVRQFHVQNLVMGTAYQFKVKSTYNEIMEIIQATA
jgi:hypothetical protein